MTTENWTLIAVGAPRWRNDASLEERHAILAGSYPVGTLASTCEQYTGICRSYSRGSAKLQGEGGGPVLVIAVWLSNEGGPSLLSLDAASPDYGPGTTATVIWP